MDRVKEWVFNVIQNDVVGATVCDLFAGSGSFGFEACSRGARSVSFVDTAKASLKLVEKNAAHLKLEETYFTFSQDALRFVGTSRQACDVVFCDPPYEFEKCQNLLEAIGEKSFLNDNGLVIFEHHVTVQLTESAKLRFVREKKFGKTMISIFEKADE